MKLRRIVRIAATPEKKIVVEPSHPLVNAVKQTEADGEPRVVEDSRDPMVVWKVVEGKDGVVVVRLYMVAGLYLVEGD